MSSISFDNVYLLLIAIPLIVLFTVPFVIAVRKDNRNGHNIASQILHIVMAVMIAFAAAGTSITSVLTETDVYVVADISYSANKNLDTIDTYIKNIKLPSNCKIGLVCFGKNAELVSSLGSKGSLASVKAGLENVDDSETDIVTALNFAGSKLSDAGNVIKRIVLITDGRQTDERDSYAVKKAVDALETQGVRVDAIFLNDNISENAREVQISSAEFTRNTYLGHAEKVRVDIQSTYAPIARVVLYRDGEMVDSTTRTLVIGHNPIDFELDTATMGEYDYEITVEAPEDESQFNNKYTFTQKVSGEIKVLFITQSWEAAQAAVTRYGDKAIVDIYENDTTVSTFVKNAFISKQGENVTIHPDTGDVPYNIEDLCLYDEIVLADMDVSKVTNFTEFVKNLDTVVSKFGKSLTTLGNLYIQNRKDKELKQLEDMLPVRFGNSDEDPKLYTFVMDISHSMEQVFHLIIAKEVACKLIDLLNDGDELCVMAFYSDVTHVMTPTTVTDTNREELKERINNLTALNGTVIGAGMQRAYEFIGELEYAEKQVMLFSDGVTYSDEPDNAVDVARDMYTEDGIVTSVFDVGRLGDYGDREPALEAKMAAAKKLLQDVAEEGHGSYYFSNNAENLDEVMFQELADEMTAAVIEKDTSVNVRRSTDDSLADIDTASGSLPNVKGYVYGTQKASATTVLTVNHVRASGKIAERPLFAHWTYGNGKVASFTSAIDGAWLADWDEVGDTFFGNVFTMVTPKEKNEAPYNIDIIRAGMFTRLEITPSTVHYGAEAYVTITLPNGDELEEEMQFNSYYYYKEFETTQLGKYTIDIVYSYNGTDYAVSEALNIAYTTEYDAFASYDTSTLHKALDGRGTVNTDGMLKIENDEREIGKYSLHLTVPLLIATVALFVVDIIVRKLKWDDIRSFLGLAKKEGKKK